MKNEEFYCDECHAKKNPSGNGWWICFLSQRDVINGRLHGVVRQNNYFNGLSLFPWNKELASERDACHLCGENCVHKHVSGFMADASRMPLSPSEVLKGEQ